MPANSDSDLLMFLRPEAGAKASAIAADSTASLGEHADSGLLEGFVAGRFFEVDNFSFGLKLNDNDAGRTGAGGGRSFDRWRAMNADEGMLQDLYKARAEEIAIERNVDRASMELMNHCLTAKPFKAAALVKRARLGSDGSFQVIMRLDFTDVFVRTVDWDDGNAIKEACRFRFGSVTVKYAKHGADGEVDSVFTCAWQPK